MVKIYVVEAKYEYPQMAQMEETEPRGALCVVGAKTAKQARRIAFKDFSETFDPELADTKTWIMCEGDYPVGRVPSENSFLWAEAYFQATYVE